jgi:hypothetical protein
MIPLWPVTSLAWGTTFWISVLLSAAAWIHIEVIGAPDDDAPTLTQWMHGLPWAVVLLLLLFGQDIWWAEFMGANFRSIWSFVGL